jgi:hypothetical protein
MSEELLSQLAAEDTAMLELGVILGAESCVRAGRISALNTADDPLRSRPTHPGLGRIRPTRFELCQLTRVHECEKIAADENPSAWRVSRKYALLRVRNELTRIALDVARV